MKKKRVVVRTRWQYYAANIIGIIAILGLLIWVVLLAVTDHGIDFKSIFFWLALLMLIMVPFPFISFLSSMKTVEVSDTGLIISYIFQKHQNKVLFSEIVEMKSQQTDRETVVRPRTFRDTFKLILADGRVFEFDRSQFDQYGKLKEVCRKRSGK